MRALLALRITVRGVFSSGAFLLCLLTVAGYLGRWGWTLDLASHFRVQYAVLLAVVTCVYLVMRARRAALCTGICCLLNAVPVIMLLWGGGGDTLHTLPAVRLLQANVNLWNTSHDRVLALVRTERPDLILLEEVDDTWMQALRPLTNDYPYRVTTARDDCFGMAILSRRPLGRHQILSAGEYKIPSVLVGVPLTSDCTVTLLGTHPVPPWNARYAQFRNEQLAAIPEYIKDVESPLLIAGDLNTSPWSWHFGQLIKQAGLKNSLQGRGLQATWPAMMPLLGIPLDHVLHSEDIVILSRRIGPDIGSDHLPVIVDFSVNTKLDDMLDARDQGLQPRL